MIELFQFQQQAADTIADRCIDYFDDPVVVGTQKHPEPVPFFQALASITASGKTVILTDAVSTIAQTQAVAPIVLWLSKGKVVVEQSYANLLPGGKYHHLLGDCFVASLGEYDQTEVAESTRPLIFFATVGTFNQKDKDEGTLLIYRSEIDTADQSTWDALKQRPTAEGQRRPLFVVYDEAHNLSDQQTNLLMELEPDAFLLASATMRLPAALAARVDELKRRGKDDTWLTTQVDAKAVADAGLVKSTLLLEGYKAPMEETVEALIADMQEAEADAQAQGVSWLPKAIYVCQTNIVEGNAFQKEDPKQPFLHRQSPPILIWRYLTEQCGVDPATIAVYATLAFHKDYGPPPEFVLFKGGDKDYADFVKGDFRHIIFNLSLQEGWDDPLCYFAYIDKSMESRVQVEQIIGRVLRQPNAKRYGADRLNTAHFYVRVDRNEVFSELIEQVSKKIASDSPQVRLVASPPGKPKPSEIPVKGDFEIPMTAYNSKHARIPIQNLLASLTDYRADGGTNVLAAGERGVIKHEVGGSNAAAIQWEEFKTSNALSARWVFQREVRRRFSGALQVADVSPGKFDAKIGIGSNAYAHVAQVAEQVVEEYLDAVYLVQKKPDPYRVGPALVRPDEMEKFQNAIHEGYDALNSLELTFAMALDQTGHPWYRNPARSGYGIPLITLGTTSKFYPDFFVWREDAIIAIDTKGGHLLQDAAARKLLRIEPPTSTVGSPGPRLIIRFVSEGRWTPEIEQTAKDGYTVWGLKQDGNRRATHYPTIEDALDRALDTDPT